MCASHPSISYLDVERTSAGLHNDIAQGPINPIATGYFKTSQWPPLSGPFLLILPPFFKLERCFLTARELILNSSANSSIVISERCPSNARIFWELPGTFLGTRAGLSGPLRVIGRTKTILVDTCHGRRAEAAGWNQKQSG
jgi:hypothetical protein